MKTKKHLQSIYKPLKAITKGGMALLFALIIHSNSNAQSEIEFKRTNNEIFVLNNNRDDTNTAIKLNVSDNQRSWIIGMPSQGKTLHWAFDYGSNQDDSNILGDDVKMSLQEHTGLWVKNNLRTLGSLGVGIRNPERPFHMRADNATFRMDRNANSVAFMMVRMNDNYSSVLKTFQFGVDAFGTDNGRFFISDYHTNVGGAGQERRLVIDNEGNIGIGTDNPSPFKLAVNGTIGAKTGIKVVPDGEAFPTVWPDYVFEGDYTLKNLNEVEAYIKTNGHLPDVPSANEINSEGVELVTMDATLLKKIEELTLYTIEQQKEINELKAIVHKLKNK